MPRILIVDDDETSLRTLKLHFSERGFDVGTAGDADSGLSALADHTADVVVSDIRMPGRDGLSLLEDIREKYPTTPVIMITAFHDLDSTVAAMHGGAVDYIQKPIDINELEAAIDRALIMHTEESGDALVLDSSDVGGTIIGRSRAMKEVFKSIGMVSQSRVTVLVLGESGTGKELVARAVHKVSQDASQPFVAVNCAALVETLLESELFGHEKGAFTGAVSSRKGKVELAGDGTLFLDEVGELSPRMQGKLLRLLEEREYMPVGGSTTKHSLARFVTATNVDLEDKVAKGEFREDLYYRLNVVTISLPALRDRREDIPLLVEHLVKKINRDLRKGIRRVPSEVMEILAAKDWPGNVRELENVLMKAVVMAPGSSLSIAQLAEITNQDDLHELVDETVNDPEVRVSSASLKEIERQHILHVLNQTGWHKGKSCDILGISRPRLDRRIREYDLSAGK
ncbi:MAG: sigma-54-dependent Fis family transcriptional regulator [Rhodospirillaceae bacterium]|jgi:DNA-binding NtrC family response regulator|nr:sigma-54-dependent Fis family transcriptional regulator [Rhodospirillaceae bacterium]